MKQSNSTPITDDLIIWRKGKKVILSPFTEEYLPSFQRWINNPLCNRFLSTHWPQHENGQRNWMEKIQTSKPDDIVLAIHTHNGILIGNIALSIDFQNQSATTGTLIGETECHRCGYGTDAKMLLLDYAFNWLNLRKVTSDILDINKPSQGYAKKCGYRYMATIEKDFFRFGTWHDRVLYVVFKEEWLPFWEKYTQDWQPDWLKDLPE